MSDHTDGAPNRPGRLVVWIIAALALLLLGAAAWLGVRGWLAKGELEAAVPLASAVRDGIIAGDTDAAVAAAGELRQHAASAASLTGDPVWRSAEILPWIGDDLAAVRILGAELDSIASEAILPLSELAGDLDLSALRPIEGRVDLAVLTGTRPVVAQAAEVFSDATIAVDAIDPSTLFDPVAGAVAEFAEVLGEARTVTQTLDAALVLVPAMLGEEGPRNYLVLFLNNAELRAAGGIAGAQALIRTDAGGIELVAQSSAADFRPPATPVLPLPDETVELFGEITGRYMQNVTMTPDFELTGRLAAEMWSTQYGGAVDGVIALDPVALSHILAATGPVGLPNGDTLSAENAVSTLLVDAYERFPEPSDQDLYFSEATRAVFSALVEGGAEPRALIEAFTRSAEERRLSIWTSHEQDQAILDGTTLAGLDRTQAGGDEIYGVYFNDATSGKMGAYLDVAIDVGTTATRDDGRSAVEVRVTLTSSAPADAATALPPYVTANGWFGVPPGVIATNVFVYAPAGAFDGGVTRDDVRVLSQTVADRDRVVNAVQAMLEPGESMSFSFHFISAEPGQDSPRVLHTPLMRQLEVGAL